MTGIRDAPIIRALGLPRRIAARQQAHPSRVHPILEADTGRLDAGVQAVIHRRLRALARSLLRRYPPDFTLRPTDLVHAAWLKLSRAAEDHASDPEHVFAVLARAVRQALVDHSRRRRAQRHGGAARRLDLDSCDGAAPAGQIEALDDLLLDLEEVAPRTARIIDLRYFGCLKVDEIADVLRLSKRTVERELRAGVAWLSAGLSAG